MSIFNRNVMTVTYMVLFRLTTVTTAPDANVTLSTEGL